CSRSTAWPHNSGPHTRPEPDPAFSEMRMRGSTTQPPALAGTVAPAVHVTHGPIRRALTYPFAAARANRALTVAVAALVIGASALLWWSPPRLWRVDAIVLAAAPPGHSATIAPNDLSKLLESAPLQEAAIDA